MTLTLNFCSVLVFGLVVAFAVQMKMDFLSLFQLGSEGEILMEVLVKVDVASLQVMMKEKS